MRYQTTYSELLILVFYGNAPVSTTCLPLVWVKNCLKLLRIALSYGFANCVKSVIFASCQRAVKCWKLVQIPYGSPHTRLRNDVKSPFLSYFFTLIRLLSFVCPLYGFWLSFIIIFMLFEVEHRSDSFTCSCLSLTEHMTVNRGCGRYR